MSLDLNFYKNKKVFITGHTGFKGSWLCLFLNRLGAKVTGYALAPESGNNNLFDLARVNKSIQSYIADIRDYKKLYKILQSTDPDNIIHLAAQPLVRSSYENPVYN